MKKTNHKLHVLLIEDSAEDAEYHVRLLQNAGYEVTWQRVETAGEMEKAMDSGTWDLILSDYFMPEFNVYAALDIYAAHGSLAPFIVISGEIGEDKAVQLIRAGVHDYLMKDNMARFVIAVEREIREALAHQALLRANAALAASEEKYKSYVENAPDMVFVSSNAGRYLEVNDAACRITGYSREELLNMSLPDLVSPEESARVKEMLSQLQATGWLSADMEIRPRDGSKRWCAIDFGWLSENRFLGYAKDITERELANQEVHKAREELQNLNKYLMDARESERATVAMEIHDELGQALTAIKIDLNWVLKHITDSDKSGEKITRIIEMTNDTIKKVQRISAELRPGLLDDLGLATAIEWYCGEFEERTGITCKLMLDEGPGETERINLSLFRIFQEALTNVIRHANATTVCITISNTPKGITMIIEDDGVGISSNKITSGKSLGLIGMRERARQIGGTVEFSQNVTAGTRLTAFIPTPNENLTANESSDCR